jgi:hypothetical protein
MGVYIVTRKNKTRVTYHVRWSRSDRTLPGRDVVYLGSFNTKKGAVARHFQKDRPLRFS